MSTKIQLDFKKEIDFELLEAGIKIELTRIVTGIRFITTEGWTDIYEAVLDTGSPISTLPYSIWREIKAKILIPHRIKFYGIGPKECPPLWGRIAELECVLIDKVGTSLPLSIQAYLADSDSVPIILGFNGILSEARFVSDYKQGNAYLEV
jgi:hypothetical protein